MAFSLPSRGKAVNRVISAGQRTLAVVWIGVVRCGCCTLLLHSLPAVDALIVDDIPGPVRCRPYSAMHNQISLPHDVTVTVYQDGGHLPNPAEFALAAELPGRR